MCTVDKPVVFDGKLRGDRLFLLITLDNMCDIEKMEFEKVAIYCRCRGDGSSEHVQSNKSGRLSRYRLSSTLRLASIKISHQLLT